MITGNLRSATQKAYIAFTKRDWKSALRAIQYSIVIIAFLAGAISGGLLTSLIGAKAAWVAVIILIGSVILFSIDKRKNKYANAVV